MNYYRIVVLLLGVLLVTSCTSLIHTETKSIKESGDFKGGTTYQWNDSSLSLMAPKEQVSSTFSNEIMQEVDKSLNKLGYSMALDDKPDFYIDAVLTLSNEEAQYVEKSINFSQEEYLQYGLKWKLFPNESIVSPSLSSTNQETSYYQRGTLHIGAFDNLGALAWHGEAHKIINSLHTPDEHGGVLREATRKLMLKFPKSAR